MRVAIPSLSLALLLLPAPVGAVETPEIHVETVPAYYGEAARLRWMSRRPIETTMELVGLEDPGDPIDVLLAPETHPAARRVPGWVSGYALSEQDLVVLLPARLPAYPYESLQTLFLHEITHILVHRASDGDPIPRWFNEGVALLASRGFAIEDRSRLLVGGVRGMPASTAALDEAFGGDAGDVAAAYAAAGALVHHLVQQHGPGVIRETLSGVGSGRAFPDAFEAAAGIPLDAAERGFWRRFRLWYRWVPFLSSGATLWLAITLLAVLAARRKRQKRREIERRWELQEELAALGAPRPVPPPSPTEDPETEGGSSTTIN